MSRFDLAVLAILSMCVLLLLGLFWQGQRAAAARDNDLSHLFFKTIDEVGRAQLHALPVEHGEFPTDVQPFVLTAMDSSVWDFAPSPDGTQIVYAALGPLGVSDLRLVDLSTGQDTLLLACEDGSCSGPGWSPDGQYLAYTRRNVNSFTSGPLSPPRIWILDIATGQTAPIFNDNQRLGLDARWSADGAWLCYVSPSEQKLGVFHVTSGQMDLYPTATGETCTWDTSQPRLYTTDFWKNDDEWMTHLIAINVESGERVDLSGVGNLVDDSSAVSSVDGVWLAFQRKELEGPGATRGNQIWRMRADGTQATALTRDAAYDHGPPVWSTDGRFLITRRFPLRGPDIVPSLWLIDLETGRLRLLLEPGDFPAFAP